MGSAIYYVNLWDSMKSFNGNQIVEENVSFLKKKKWWHLKPWFTKYQIFTGFSHILYEIILWKDELLKNNCVQK